jgi:small subunit ribosomal protein S13|tara:strand:- start:862 stop:1224 length:363 start_codon:yes stop_codon:yes gene_type:complete
MLYLFGVNLSEKENIKTGVQKIFSVGNSKSRFIVASMGVSQNVKTNIFSKRHINRLKAEIQKDYNNQDFKTRSQFQKAFNENISRLQKIRSYKSSRFQNGLPLRGQRTHTNAKTSRKNRF